MTRPAMGSALPKFVLEMYTRYIYTYYTCMYYTRCSVLHSTMGIELKTHKTCFAKND